MLHNTLCVMLHNTLCVMLHNTVIITFTLTIISTIQIDQISFCFINLAMHSNYLIINSEDKQSSKLYLQTKKQFNVSESLQDQSYSGYQYDQSYDSDQDDIEHQNQYIRQLKTQKINKLLQKAKEFNELTAQIICYQDRVKVTSSLLNQIIDLRERIPKFQLQYKQTLQTIKIIAQNQNPNIHQALKTLSQNKKYSQKQVIQWQQNYLKYVAKRNFKILKKLKLNNQKKIFPRFIKIHLSGIQKGSTIKFNVQKYLKLPIFYNGKHIQVTDQFYQNLNVKNQKKFIKDISQTLYQLKKLGISNNKISVKNIIYSIKDNRFKIIDYDLAVFCQGQQKNENNYTVIQYLNFEKLQEIQKKSMNSQQISQNLIDQAIFLNYSFQMKINIFSLEDIIFVKKSFSNFRTFMEKNNGKFDLLMFAYLLISLFKKPTLTISEQNLIQQIKNPMIFSDLNKLSALKRQFCPIIKPFLTSIFKVLRFNLSKAEPGFDFYQIIKQDLQKSTKYSSCQSIQQNYSKTYQKSQNRDLRILDPYERFLNRLLQQISMLQRTHAGQDSASSSCSSIQHLLSDYNFQSSTDQILPQMKQKQTEIAQFQFNNSLNLTDNKQNQKIFNLNLQISQINGFAFLLKTWDIYEQIYENCFGLIKNYKKLNLTNKQIRQNHIQNCKNNAIRNFFKLIYESHKLKLKVVDWTDYSNQFWKTKYYYKRFEDKYNAQIRKKHKNKLQKKYINYQQYSSLIKCLSNHSLQYCKGDNISQEIFLFHNKAKKYWNCRFLLEKNRQFHFQLKKIHLELKFQIHLSKSEKINKAQKKKLAFKKLTLKCKKIIQLFDQNYQINI